MYKGHLTFEQISDNNNYMLVNKNNFLETVFINYFLFQNESKWILLLLKLHTMKFNLFIILNKTLKL